MRRIDLKTVMSWVVMEWEIGLDFLWDCVVVGGVHKRLEGLINDAFGLRLQAWASHVCRFENLRRNCIQQFARSRLIEKDKNGLRVWTWSLSRINILHFLLLQVDIQKIRRRIELLCQRVICSSISGATLDKSDLTVFLGSMVFTRDAED